MNIEAAIARIAGTIVRSSDHIPYPLVVGQPNSVRAEGCRGSIGVDQNAALPGNLRRINAAMTALSALPGNAFDVFLDQILHVNPPSLTAITGDLGVEVGAMPPASERPEFSASTFMKRTLAFLLGEFHLGLYNSSSVCGRAFGCICVVMSTMGMVN